MEAQVAKRAESQTLILAKFARKPETNPVEEVKMVRSNKEKAKVLDTSHVGEYNYTIADFVKMISIKYLLLEVTDDEAYTVFLRQVAAKVCELDDERKNLFTKLSAKQEDAFEPTIEIEIGLNKFSALCYLREGVSTIPKSIYESLSLGPYSNAQIILNMTNSTFTHTIGIKHVVVVQINDCHANFDILLHHFVYEGCETYEQLTLEFLSSLSHNVVLMPSEEEEDRITFCVLDQDIYITTDDWCNHFGFANNDDDFRYVYDFTDPHPGLSFYQMSFYGSRQRASCIGCPAIRYFYYVITLLLEAQGDVSKGAPPAHEAPQQQDQHNGWGVLPASPPQAPQLPPYLYNFQAWLAAQGLQVQDGLVPEDNISDSASQAWNDAISNSNSSASTNLSAGSLNPLVIHSQTHQRQHSEGLLRISVEVHNSGIRFGLCEHGELVLTLLLTDPAPRQQLNDFIFRAIKPLMASKGPWNTDYGFRHECMQVEVAVALNDDGIIFSNTCPTLPMSSTSSTVIIEALSPEQALVPPTEPTDPLETDCSMD
ncbi:hypothetical protein D1007_40212 [Hordeum vulgare]|nr:hypothetical protein D1007_40212 [Hordeum vulgare]